jgi:hypothetical protein
LVFLRLLRIDVRIASNSYMFTRKARISGANRAVRTGEVSWQMTVPAP